MKVAALRHKMEDARVRLNTGPASPARQEGVRQITEDLATLSRARGETLDEVRRHCDQADRLKTGGEVSGVALGLGIGTALALNAGDPITAAVLGLGGAAMGAMVLFYLGRDAGSAAASKFIQPVGVRAVVDRWTADTPPLQPGTPGKQNAVTDLLHEVRSELAAFPDGPDKNSAMALIDQDLQVAGKAQGVTLPEVQEQTRKRERLVSLGTYTGIGIGVVLTGALVARACQGLVDPLTAIRGTVMGSGISLVGSWQAGKWVGGKLGDRHQVSGMKEVLERWQPVFEERERTDREAREQATKLVEGGEKAAIRVEAGGLRVGGVLLRVPKRGSA